MLGLFYLTKKEQDLKEITQKDFLLLFVTALQPVLHAAATMVSHGVFDPARPVGAGFTTTPLIQCDALQDLAVATVTPQMLGVLPRR